MQGGYLPRQYLPTVQPSNTKYSSSSATMTREIPRYSDIAPPTLLSSELSCENKELLCCWGSCQMLLTSLSSPSVCMVGCGQIWLGALNSTHCHPGLTLIFNIHLPWRCKNMMDMSRCLYWTKGEIITPWTFWENGILVASCHLAKETSNVRRLLEITSLNKMET